MRLVLVLLSSSVMWGACHSIGEGRWYCPSTGDPDADGADARNFIAGALANGGDPGKYLQYACGDTIILDSGATYGTFRPGNGWSYPYLLTAHCPANKKVKIVGTRAAEMPDGYIPQMSDMERMVKIQTRRGRSAAPYSGLGMWGSGASGYYLDGIAFTSDPEISAVDHTYFNGAAVSISTEGLRNISEAPRHIELHHILVTNGENELYGPIYACQSFACLQRGSPGGFSLNGVDILVEDSAVYGTGGFDPTFSTSTATITNASAQSPTRLTSPGVASFLGIANAGSACVNANTGRPWCSQACEAFANPPGCKMVMIEGAPAGWESLNGTKFAIYVDANTVAINNADGYELYMADESTSVDGTTAPAWTGTAKIRVAGPSVTPVYNIVTGVADNIRVVHSHVENGDMTVFGAGGSFATSTGTVQAGSTDTSIIIRNATGPVDVGDLIAVAAPGYSAWCGAPGGSPGNNACYAGGVRIGKITEVSGTAPNYTFTVIPEGPPGIDVAPTATTLTSPISSTATSITVADARGIFNGAVMVLGPGPVEEWVRVCSISGNTLTVGHSACPNADGRGFYGTGASPHGAGANVGSMAQWKGLNPSRLAYLRNDFLRDYRNFPTGKGPLEWKAAVRSVIDGNVFHGSRLVTSFIEVKDQGEGGTSPQSSFGPGPTNSSVPWSTVRDTRVSNNLYSGGSRWVMNSSDYEGATTWSLNTWFENNVATEAPVLSQGKDFFESSMIRNGGYRHNTINAYLKSPTGWYVNGQPPNFSCIANKGGVQATAPDDYGKTETQIMNNLMSFGEGMIVNASGEDCWLNQSTAVKGNTFIADGSKTTSHITTNWPGNNAATDLAGVGMKGPCTFANWRNCGLAPSSPYKGTATDGRDPGADIYQVDDHINGWSQRAGLAYYEALTGTIDQTASAFDVGATHAVMKFTRFGAVTSCALKIYTDASRQTLHPDTNTSGRQACSRLGNLDEDGTVQFVVGINTPLNAATTYYYELFDGPRVMPGQFTTAAAEPIGPISVQLGDPTAADAYIEYAATTSFSGSTQAQPAAFVNQVATPIAFLSGVQYYRWVKRDGSGRVQSVGPAAVALRP